MATEITNGAVPDPVRESFNALTIRQPSPARSDSSGGMASSPSGGVLHREESTASPLGSPLSPYLRTPLQQAFGGELDELVRAMKHPETGVHLADRTHLLRTYPNCFIGSEAVTWLLANGAGRSREEAVEIGNWLMSCGVFFHVTREHYFKDKGYYYVFDPNWPVPHPLEVPSISSKISEPTGERVVIIGGGPGGATAAKLLQYTFRVTLIDTKDYYENTPALPKILVNPGLHANQVVSHVHYLTRATFIHGCVVDVQPNFVLLADGTKVEFEYCIIASGSSYSEPIKIRSSRFFESNCINYVSPSVSDRQTQMRELSIDIQNSDSIIVVGGGPVGVEIASEIICKYPFKKVTLVHGADRLLERMPAGCSQKALKWFQRNNVDVILNQFVQSTVSDSGHTLESGVERRKDVAAAGGFKTSNGQTLSGDLLLRMIGIVPNSQFVHFPHALNERKQIIVNDKLQLPGHLNIFAIGDVNNRPEEKMAYFAEHQGHYVAHTIIHMAFAEDSPSYAPPPFQMLVNFGPRAGVYVNNGCHVPIPDFIAGKLKHSINKLGIHSITGCFPDSLESQRCFTCKMAAKFGP